MMTIMARVAMVQRHGSVEAGNYYDSDAAEEGADEAEKAEDTKDTKNTDCGEETRTVTGVSVLNDTCNYVINGLNLDFNQGDCTGILLEEIVNELDGRFPGGKDREFLDVCKTLARLGQQKCRGYARSFVVGFPILLLARTCSYYLIQLFDSGYTLNQCFVILVDILDIAMLYMFDYISDKSGIYVDRRCLL